MTYTAPYIDNTGLHTNTYSDILDYLLAQMHVIYGDDIYLGTDSQDYQMLSVFARMIYEEEQCSQMNYQARSPVTASTDDAVDALVTMNGITRKSASYSTVTVTLTGIAYTTITGGVVKSTAGDKWNLPQSVVIGPTGTVSVVATAQELGAIKASAGTITQIVTPTYGWTSVTNPNAASVGQPVETTAELKARQQSSVAIPSQTPKEGVEAAIYNVSGVTDFVVYENDTSITANYNTQNHTGGPAHSITCVIKGGSDNDIANAIDLRKTIGCYLEGDVVVSVLDEYNSPNIIRFYRPDETLVYITLNIKALSGYSSEIATLIKEAIVSYLGELKIGHDLYISQLYEAALSVSPDVKPYFAISSITQGTTSGSQSSTDLTAAFDGLFYTNVASITINVLTT